MNFTERIANAEKELLRIKAMSRVYDMLKNSYQSNFCDYKKDENGDYMTDENGDLIYEERENMGTWDFNYDADFGTMCRDIFRELMTSLEKMK